MTKEDRKAEDVAAVLQGLKKCYYCAGNGTQWFNKENACPVCKGRRWIRNVVGDYYTDENRNAWVYDGNNWLKVQNV